MSIMDVTAAPHPRFPVQGRLLLATGDALIHSSMMVTMSSDGNNVVQCSCMQQHPPFKGRNSAICTDMERLSLLQMTNHPQPFSMLAMVSPFVNNIFPAGAPSVIILSLSSSASTSRSPPCCTPGTKRKTLLYLCKSMHLHKFPLCMISFHLSKTIYLLLVFIILFS